jgi:DNA-binding MarR family transcriptional regulator
MKRPLRESLPLLRVLAAMLEEPDARHYGFDLYRRTGVKSGSLYPILRTLEVAGWVTSEWESVDELESGRPRRRYYRLTPTGLTNGPVTISEVVSELMTWKPRPADS